MLSGHASEWFIFLAGVSLKSAAILAIAWLLAFFLRRRSSATRHLVWTAAAAAVLALPLLSTSLPALRLPVANPLVPDNVGLVFRVFANATPDAPASAAADLPRPAAATAQANLFTQWRLGLLLVWSLGAAALLAQMLISYLRMRRIRASSSAFADAGLCAELASRLEIEHPVAVLETPPGSMPMTFGLRRPVVLLPADAADWTEERLRMVLLHELAHVRRADAATHLMARAALVLNWWNPLAWIAWREFLRASECAADDLVLQSGAQASSYAGHLLEVARSMQSLPASAWVGLAMARRSQLEGRLLAILDRGLNRRAVGRLAPLAAILGAVLLVAPFAAVSAQDQQSQGIPPDVDASIRAANAQKNHEILEHAASAFENLRQFDVAQKLLENALTIRGQVSGEQSAAYAAGLVKLGDLELKRHNEAEAQAFYTKAVSLGDRPEVVSALVYLGMRSMRKEPAVARSLFQRAIASDPKSAPAGQALTWLAEMRSAEPNGAAEAEDLYRRALAVERENSTEAANTMFLFARFLREAGREPEAVTFETRAKDITKTQSEEVVKSLGLRFRAETTVRADGSYARPTSNDTPATTPVPPPPTGNGVFRVGGGVSAPALLSKREPEYTEEARAAKYQGSVLLYIEVDPTGHATNIRVARSLGLGLDEKAIEAVSQWRFRPGMKDGQPVTVAATIEVNFKLL